MSNPARTEAPVPVLAVIPARMESQRYPGKVLADLLGAPMILHVLRAVQQSRLVDKVVVATDSVQVQSVVIENGGVAIMTRSDHQSGSDRIAEVAEGQPDFDLIVNVQADEPMISPSVVDELVQGFGTGEGFVMGTLARKISDASQVKDPNSVKVVFDRAGSALYFSRAPIPFRRGKEGPSYYKHVGVYLFRRDFLLKFPTLPPSALEAAEKLEQLRVLEAGYRIRVVKTNYESHNVETAEDLAKVRELMRAKRNR